MILSYSSLALFCFGVAVIWFWHDSLRARDVANGAAMAACERIGLQFLDGTAAFANLRFARVDGRIRLKRTYVFDYTSQSIERRQGFAILVGMEIEYVGFAPEQTARPDVLPATREITPNYSNPRTFEHSANVFDLNEHRARRVTPTGSDAETPPESDPESDPDSVPDSDPKSDRLN